MAVPALEITTALRSQAILWRLMNDFDESPEVTHLECIVEDDTITEVQVCGAFSHGTATLRDRYKAFTQYLYGRLATIQLMTKRVVLCFNYDEPGLIIVDNGQIAYMPDDSQLRPATDRLRELARNVGLPHEAMDAIEDDAWAQAKPA